MRLLFVHAHPDDESLWTGIALAHHVAAGDEVHVLTCTLGEEGEVIPAELAHLELPPGEPRDPAAEDALGAVRRAELREAMAAVGVASSVVLGEDGGPRYRDSGMVGMPSAAHPRAFAHADLFVAAASVADHIERVGADVVVTYDAHGGYGHPDHIQTHRVTVEAVRTMSARPALFAVLTPRSWAQDDATWLAQNLTSDIRARHHVRPPDADDSAALSVVDDDVVTHQTVDADAIPVQRAALAAHRTQVRVFPDFFALSNDVAVRLPGRVGYAEIDPDSGSLVAGMPGAARRGLTQTGRAEAAQ